MAVRCLFIDSAVPNPQNLLATLEEGTSVHWLDPKTDGLHQIATTLAGFQQLETILIFAHGAPGAIQLGKLSLTEATLGRYAEELATIGQSLTPDGGVQLYVCDLGRGTQGGAFVAALEAAIGAPCAAASTPVGHGDFGGRWTLDVGTLSAPTFANPQWSGILGLTVTNNGIASPGRSGGEQRNASAFAALRADGSVITWGGTATEEDGTSYNYGGDSSAVANQLNGTIEVTQIFSTDYAFAALRADGSVITWGGTISNQGGISYNYGGNSSAVASQLNGTIDVTRIFSTGRAFAALRSDGSVVTWGGAITEENNTSYGSGGDSSAVASQLNGTIDVTQISSTGSAFAALRADGSVVTWGDFWGGGDSSAVARQLNGTIDVTQVFSTISAFAALRADGSVITWDGTGTDDDDSSDSYGGDSSAVASQINGTIDVTQIFSTEGAFAALRADGSVITWGGIGTYEDGTPYNYGGDSSAVAGQLNGTIDVTQIFSTDYAFAALRADGSVVTWGGTEAEDEEDSSENYGGNSSAVTSQIDGTIDVTRIFSTEGAFAALRADGSVVTWGSALSGGNSSAVASQLDGTIDATQIWTTGEAFAALRADGSVITWGASSWGGDSSAVASQLDGTIDVTRIFTTGGAFAALRADGSVVTWGFSLRGGDSSAVADQLTDVVSMANPYTDDVYQANLAPVIATPLSDRTVTEGTAFSFTLPANSFTDADGSTLTYSARRSSGAALPAWLSFNASTRTFSGTAPTGSPNYTVRVTADDGQGGTVSDDFRLTTRTAIVANAITLTAVNGDTHTSEGGDTARYTLALSNPLTSGALRVILTSLDTTEGRFLVQGKLANRQTVTFDRSHQSVTLTIKGIQDYEADGSASYRIAAVATNGAILANSPQGAWTSAISAFNGAGAHNETLVNDPDLTPGGADRDIGVRLNGRERVNDRLTGFDGGDRISGLGGNDRLDGAIGNDTLEGGAGRDTLTGGAGADVFRFGSVNDARDLITDFLRGTDKLQFVQSPFGGLTTTALSQGRLVCNATGTAAGKKAQFIFNTRTSVLTYDSNGTAAGSATTLATLTNVRTLSANDFLMVTS